MRKLAAVVVLLGGLSLWWHSHRTPADRGQTLVFDRLWVDKLPQKEVDTFQLFAAVKRESLGVFMASSAWRGQWEQFRFEPRGDGQLELLYPQTGERQRVSYRAWKCNERREFDFCLELTGGKGAKKYYSQRGWEIDSLDGERALERKLLAR
jgi:hypothetical protein